MNGERARHTVRPAGRQLNASGGFLRPPGNLTIVRTIADGIPRDCRVCQ